MSFAPYIGLTTQEIGNPCFKTQNEYITIEADQTMVNLDCHLSPDEMRKIGRYDHRDLTESCYDAILLPSALEYHFVHPVLFYRVRVGSAGRKKISDDGRGSFVMAVEQILADKVATFPVLFDRAVILIDDDPVLVTDGYRTVQLFCPVRYHIHRKLMIIICFRISIRSRASGCSGRGNREVCSRCEDKDPCICRS